MAGIRGVKDPTPKAGKPNGNMFSTNGSQKMDGTSGFKHKDVEAYALGGKRCGPVKRDNRIKGG